MAYHDKTPQGMDKVSRYKWDLQDMPGQLKRIDKADIRFDEAYQRQINHAKVRAIARDWSWLALGVITVAQREGRYFAVDGMHRVSAAMLRSDVSDLPCVVFQSSSVKDEAKAFIRANTNRKAVTTAQSHKAKIVAGDEVAIFVQSLLDSAGLQVSTSSHKAGGIKCLGVMHKLAKNRRDALLRAWPLVCEVSDGHPINERVLEGLVYLAAHASQDINERKWRERIIRLGHGGIKAAAESAAAYYAKGGARVWADGIAQALNKGLQHKMELQSGAS